MKDEPRISFYCQLAEHYAQQLFESQAQTAQFLSVIQDGGSTLYRYLQIVRSTAESTRQFLSVQPDTPTTLTDEKHRFYGEYLAHIERLEKNYADILPDVLIDLTLPQPTLQSANVAVGNVDHVSEKAKN